MGREQKEGGNGTGQRRGGEVGARGGGDFTDGYHEMPRHYVLHHIQRAHSRMDVNA